MTLYQLRILIKAAPKIFLWAALSNELYAYFLVNKSVITEYLDTIDEISEEIINAEISDNGELYLGRPLTEG